MTRSALLIVLVSAVACASPDDGIRITATEYGPRWPFTLESGTLRCQKDRTRQYVTFDDGQGVQYGLNGAARGLGFPDGLTILKPGKTGADLQPFIDRGLTLCQ